MHRIPLAATLLLSFIGCASTPPSDLASERAAAIDRFGPSNRFGVTGRILSLDAERRTVQVEVLEIPHPRNTVGTRPPADVQPGGHHAFAVEPAGPRLTRTVIKGPDGRAADPQGTEQGFARALAELGPDRPLALSLARSDAGAEPAYKVMLIHALYTPEELEAMGMRRMSED